MVITLRAVYHYPQFLFFATLITYPSWGGRMAVLESIRITLELRFTRQNFMKMQGENS